MVEAIRQFTREYVLENWQRKLVAILSAVMVYILVSQSITTTRTIQNIPVHVRNVPQDKIVEGMLPSGILSKRIALTLTGTKSVLDELEPGDLEVFIDASNRGDEWVVQIGRKNLFSLNPDLSLLNHITEVNHSELILRLSRLITVRVPVSIEPPPGEPPSGYQFLDVWPIKLYHRISGPEDQVEELQSKGLSLKLDLSQITKEQLDRLSAYGEDEVSFLVPAKWKRVAIPFHNNALEELNDPEAAKLHINFLRKDVLPLREQLPVRLFFPSRYSETLNPNTYSIEENNLVNRVNGMTRLTLPVFARNVSRQFLDVVRESVEIVVIAAPKVEREQLAWSVEFVNEQELEDTYVTRLLQGENLGDEEEIRRRDHPREAYLRNRFREYMRSFELMKSRDQRVRLGISLSGAYVSIEEQSGP